MKKSLEEELMGLAKKILQLKGKADVHELKAIAAVLYEKLSILAFAEKKLSATEKKAVENALVEKSGVPRKAEKDEERYAPDGMHYNPEGITEPNTEKIKDIVAQMPPESHEVDEVLDDILPREKNKQTDLRDIAVHYDDLPQFEPVKKPEKPPRKETLETPSSEQQKEKTAPEEKTFPKDKQSPPQEKKPEEKPKFPKARPEKEPKINEQGHKKSLNDRLKKGISFGLNERLVFVKHLFNGNTGDYDRVLSQLNTFDSYEGAKRFIETVVKPDYGNWEDKESYEERFLAAVESKLG